jgi:hypothetical protein
VLCYSECCLLDDWLCDNIKSIRKATSSLPDLKDAPLAAPLNSDYDQTSYAIRFVHIAVALVGLVAFAYQKELYQLAHTHASSFTYSGLVTLLPVLKHNMTEIFHLIGQAI